MILIISEDFDNITDKVTDYFAQMGLSFTRINSSTPIKSIDYADGYYTITFWDMATGAWTRLSSEDIDKLWYRRGFIGMPENTLDSGDSGIAALLEENWKIITEAFYQHLHIKCSFTLGSFAKEINDNKLADLAIARKAGLKVPETIITASKAELTIFREKHQKIITKPISMTRRFTSGNSHFHITGTRLITAGIIAQFPDLFFPSVVQQYIEKSFELRVFFIGALLFPVAIFSQSNEQTKVDYRNYDLQRQNRLEPFHLPDSLRGELIAFIGQSGLDTGSIDIIVSPDNQYYFLEVNPSGQFENISNMCNFNIEKYIAGLFG